jgi:O-antigen/teichoic acid export membrane protein
LYFIKYFTNKLNIGSKIKKNILLLLLIKALGFFIGIFMVPLTLAYIEPTKYGVWLTLSSIVGWLGLLDIGLGNGLRNKLGDAWAKSNNDLARTFVSTTYASLVLIVLLANIIFWIVNPFLDWTSILKVKTSLLNEVKLLVIIVFTLFTIRMITGLILTILSVDHRPAFADFLVFTGSFLTLLVIYILTLTTKNSLLLMGIGLSIFSPLVPLIASIWLFNKDYRHISPSFSYIDFKKVKGLVGQSVQFFLLQIASLILSMTDMIIISRLYGPEEVVPYNISYRLFGYVFVLFHMVITPFWAAFNEAYNKQDFIWVRKVIYKLIKIWFIVSLGVILLILISGYIYPIWIGTKIFIPQQLSFFMGILVILQSFNAIFSTFIFSTGKLRVLTILAIFVGLLNIPLCYILAETFYFGVSGIILATIICTLLNAVFGFIQYKKIITQKDAGIWAK